ncbi:cytochrome c-type biogenesis protein CcmH [Siccirubricoccus sp. KC 17139]|uniref:Cytochrome c-type biogenesis protein n=1 Tax=Siccirubricoccus soli TaxID=2899147 RepID=A0ABT1D8E8_9PROT|nr:cytochrome c-type biogenesis protein [Siccirubricoccus soli]MCO6418209.1 cytochrome c-type biogenesis protein CcmH [Siccirubricoccus soli]MCP2684344.1 cytochrome c-type biogenesis protein CcmH [Siccirubricoccus soli]
MPPSGGKLSSGSTLGSETHTGVRGGVPSLAGVRGQRPRSYALVALLLLASPALAAVGDPAEQLRDPALEEKAREIGRELRCMVCQNQSIEDSDADLARDLRRIVREQVAAGRSEREVVAYLHDRYGDYVLLRPPLKPETVLLWATPAIALAGGVALVLAMRRRAAMAPEAAPLSAEEEARLAARLKDHPEA